MNIVSSTDLIAEIEHVVQDGSPERRAQILRQLTSLFVSDADRLSQHQVDVFDDVFIRLADWTDLPTLAALSAALSVVPSPPRQAVCSLAFHVDPTVAGPVLLSSAALVEDDLVDLARDRSQQHLVAIAGRTILSERLTDVLLSRSDTNVARVLAMNAGAQFSRAGLSTLVTSARLDDDIADYLVVRSDIPDNVIHELVATATKPVQARLLKTAPPAMRRTIEAAIKASDAKAAAATPRSVDYSEAQATVTALNSAGKLNDSTINRFAIRGEQRNVVAALSLLATVPIHTIEELMEQRDCSGLIIACRASRLNWNTTLAVITHRGAAGMPTPHELEQGKDVFDALCLSTAQQTIRCGLTRDFAARSRAARHNFERAGASG